MLSRLASYLLGGAEAAAEDGVAGGSQDKENEPGLAVPVEARLRQVEVEGDDWILIDRNVEGYASMDESWYVTPPACFTQPGPVHVETSPLEDLLIEHPSMSVYRSAGKSIVEKPEPKQQRSSKKRPAPAPSNDADRMPLGNIQAVTVTTARDEATTKPPKPSSASSSASSSRPSHHHHNNNHHHHHQGAAAAAAVVEQAPRRPSIRDLRNARGDDSVRIVQIRSAQKLLEKRASQTAKRNLLDRSNKTREVASSGKSRRPRRQDRLRLNNSGANNNRKC